MSSAPTPAAGSDAAAPPSAAEYARHGIAVEGLEALLAEHGGAIAEDATTSDVCHALIKPLTVPAGWADEYELIDATKRWYTHRYREQATGAAQDAAPPGTRSYCELLLASAATAAYVGRPTIFLSHAWMFRFRNVVAALRAFVDGLPPGAPPTFVWFDCFSIDEHATQTMPQEWWGSTFREAIALIGHTVMMLSPWDAPVPLARAWCLWELFCTAEQGVEFSVCLGPEEQRAFEAAILEKHDVLFDVFESIDVARSEAGSEADRAMILGAVEATVGGSARLNGLAFERMREWVVGTVRRLAAAAPSGEGGWKTKGQVANLFSVLRMTGEAKRCTARWWRARPRTTAVGT